MKTIKRYSDGKKRVVPDDSVVPEGWEADPQSLIPPAPTHKGRVCELQVEETYDVVLPILGVNKSFPVKAYRFACPECGEELLVILGKDVMSEVRRLFGKTCLRGDYIIGTRTSQNEAPFIIFEDKDFIKHYKIEKITDEPYEPGYYGLYSIKERTVI